MPLILAIAMILSGFTYRGAFKPIEDDMLVSDADKEQLIVALEDIYLEKELWDLEEVNFSDLRIGAPVKTYICAGGQLSEGNEMYPLTIGGRLVLWAIQRGNQFYFAQGLINEVNSAISEEQAFAIIYDAMGTYLYTNGEIQEIAHYDTMVVGRGLLAETILDPQQIKTTMLSSNTRIGFSRPANLIPRELIPTYDYCDVDTVLQGSYDKICWAACIACIVNYVKGTNLTARSVAEHYYEDDFNTFVFASDIPNKINAYDRSVFQYHHHESMSGINTRIGSSIREGFPVIGSFGVGNSANQHAVVIYGINVISGRIRIMDPMCGRMEASVSGNTYAYYAPYNGITIELKSIVYWDDSF